MLKSDDIKLLRQGRKFTQAELAEKSDIPQWRISLLERGIPPKPDEAARLQDALTRETKDNDA